MFLALFVVAAAAPRTLDAGYAHACVVESRKVRCWGSGDSGERGDGSLTDVVEVAAGAYFTCALRGDGTVWCWGQNHSYGQLGDGTRADRAAPARVAGLDGVVTIDAGHGHACAVKRDGTVWCWGGDDAGQSSGEAGPDRSEPVRVAGVSEAIAVSAGRRHTCARTKGGAASCWGANDEGQLGRTGSGVVRVPLDGIADLDAGEFATCAVRADGSVWCWGANEAGLVVLGGPPLLAAPTRVDNLAAATVSLGQNHACAATAAGEVWCWGHRRASGVPIADPDIYVHGPERLARPSVEALAVGAGFTCVVSGGEPACWGDVTAP